MLTGQATPIYDGVLTENRGEIRTVTINRPAHRNALTPDASRYLARHLEAIGRDPEARVVLLRGAQGHFCVGLDLKWFAELDQTAAEVAFEEGLAAFQSVVRSIIACPLPVVAVLEGSVAGIGLDIALACDLRVASWSATFTSAFGRMGLVPDGGSTYTLPRLTGLGRALEILMTSDSIDARRAEALGMLNAVYPPERFEAEVEALGGRLAANARLSLERIKRLARGTERVELERQLELEGRAQLSALRSAEFRSRLAAFLDQASS